MTINSLFRNASIAVALSSVSAVAAEGWMTDFEAAKKKAAAENKTLLLEFTGSDWCPPCRMLGKNVFSKAEFVAEASKKFVLVELDYPRAKPQPAELKLQNRALQAKYSITSYPTILLIDAKGRPFARAGFLRGGPAEYNKLLVTLLTQEGARDKGFAAAKTLEGKEKANALEEALKVMKGVPYNMYAEELATIAKLNPESEFASRELLNVQLAKLDTKADAEAALKAVDLHITKFKVEGDAKQKILLTMVNPLIKGYHFDILEAELPKIVAVNPDSRIGKGLDNFAKARLGMLKEKMLKEKAEKEAAEKAEAEKKAPAAK